jgi:hypothetical protein
MALGGQTFATFTATIIENAPATDGCHAAAKAMTAFADQFTGLVRTLHGFTPQGNSPGVYGLRRLKSTLQVRV